MKKILMLTGIMLLSIAVYAAAVKGWGFPKTKTTVFFAYSRGFSGRNPTLQLNYELVK
ncbi:MAG TPA: hypothetical protein PK514_11760 [Spirochaetota bacterium]|nr:hypothetical protein [Spirochaetota bacterium]